MKTVEFNSLNIDQVSNLKQAIIQTETLWAIQKWTKKEALTIGIFKDVLELGENAQISWHSCTKDDELHIENVPVTFLE